jgi:hypothetical protein
MAKGAASHMSRSFPGLFGPGIGGIHENSAGQQVAVEIGHQGTDVPQVVRGFVLGILK